MNWRVRARRVVRGAAIGAERRWDSVRQGRSAGHTPSNFRIVTYLGHGSGQRVIVRGRVLDNPEPPAEVDGEGTWAAVRRTGARFLTDELPGVPLQVHIGSAVAETKTDAEGYFDLELDLDSAYAEGPLMVGEVRLAAPYRGVNKRHATPLHVRMTEPGAAFGVISDIDDTILHTGAQRVFAMIAQTVTGSALTRVPFVGSPELYQALAANRGAAATNPVFYVSSSPWNLYGFLVAFLAHRDFPRGPVMLRDLLGNDVHRTHGSHKLLRIAEVLDLHPELPFVLIGDSGQHDPEIYARVVREHPGRILAVYIREVRLDPGDRRVEAITDEWKEDVPFVLAADSAAVAEHAAALGLITASDARGVEQATNAE